jgi:antibiotic biosynthesis monooxygenase (ABM) superfamily enzyme
MALLTWAAAFPLLTAVNVLFGPQLAALPLPIRTFLLTGMLVSLLTFVIMPRLSEWCARWLLVPGAARGTEEKAMMAEKPGRTPDNLSAEPAQI